MTPDAIDLDALSERTAFRWYRSGDAVFVTGEGVLLTVAERDALVQMARAYMAMKPTLSPCPICGYNGPNYFQPSVHPCAAGWTSPEAR